MMNRQVIINAMKDCRDDTRSFWVWMHGYLSSFNEDEGRQADEDGWIKHRGKGRPVRNHIKVKVRFRNGMDSEGLGSDYDWDADGSEYDIIAYRILDE